MKARRRRRRRTAARRIGDRYTVIVQRVILAVGTASVIYGQAEMLGEPWRHLMAVVGVIVLVAVAIWMKET